MGQTYTVEARMRFKDENPREFCRIAADRIRNVNGVAAKFDLSRGSLDDPFGIFKILTSKKADIDPDGIWYADFSASYGWEPVMLEIFMAAFEGLSDDAEIMIYPDDGLHILRRVDGEVVDNYSDYAEDD